MSDSIAKTPPVAATLTEMGIPHQVFRHTGPVTSLAQAALERDQTPEQVIRSILFRVGQDAYMMSYSPFDNLEAKVYPPVLATAGLNDPRVQHWEPAKWTAKLRAEDR